MPWETYREFLCVFLCMWSSGSKVNDHHHRISTRNPDVSQIREGMRGVAEQEPRRERIGIRDQADRSDNTASRACRFEVSAEQPQNTPCFRPNLTTCSNPNSYTGSAETGEIFGVEPDGIEFSTRFNFGEIPSEGPVRSTSYYESKRYLSLKNRRPDPFSILKSPSGTTDT